MCRQLSRSSRQLILPGAPLLLVLVGLAACVPRAEPEVVEIPHPSLEAVEAEAREQIEAARRRLDELEADDVDRATLAAASIELGRLYQAYDFDQAALAAYTNAVARAPETFEHLYHLGALELETGAVEGGVAHLERALELEADDPPTLMRLGRAALDRGDYPTATALYERAAEAAPRCSAAHFGAGLAAMGSGGTAEAVDAFRRALELEPEATQIHRPLAIAYRDLGDTETARRHLSRAGTAVPSCPDPLMARISAAARGASALFERAALADLEGRSGAALELARRAVEADAGHAAARRLHGQLLTRAGRFDEALAELEEAGRLEPEDRRTHLLLGRAHRERGDLASSAEALRRALELDPRYARARLELALTLIEQRRWGDARATLEEGLTLAPDDLDLKIQLARAQAAMGELDASRRELEAVVALDPALAAAHLALGSMELDAGRTAAAGEHLEKAVAGEGTAETYALAHYQLARIAAGSGDEEAARAHLESATELAPALVAAHLALAELELASGRHARATELFAEAARMRPDLPQPRVGRARTLLAAGRHLDARRRLETDHRELPRDPEVAHLLARVLATAPAPRVRDGRRALELATGLFADRKTLHYGETVAMALAELGRFEEAVDWQTRLLDQARAGGGDPETFEGIEARLAEYRRGRPARVAW